MQRASESPPAEPARRVGRMQLGTMVSHAVTPWGVVLFGSVASGQPPPESLLPSLWLGSAAFGLVGVLHASLLLRYRGSRPLLRSLLLGFVSPFVAGFVLDGMLLPYWWITLGHVRLWWTWVPLLVAGLGPVAFTVVAGWLGVTAWCHLRAFQKSGGA